MILTTIVGIILGLLIFMIGWLIYSKNLYPPLQQEIDSLRREAANAKQEDQPIKWMYVSDAEASLRDSYLNMKVGRLVMILGIVVIMTALTFLA